MDSALVKAQFINLVTFRKDGREVPTPVWFAELDGKLYAYTLREAGKLKRIRANGRVKVAPCDMRGKVLGSWSVGSGKII
ncbi:MAG TPA: PPOX class F420-dependent oxidoreductase, partial [bacterium]